MRDTIDMAREAGFEAMRLHGVLPHVPKAIFIANVCVTEEVNRLVAFVRADERNLWPAEMEAMERQVNILTDALAAEREACARVCESLPMQQEIDVRDECAAAIRNRGNT
jgi:hypothetical protein